MFKQQNVVLLLVLTLLLIPVTGLAAPLIPNINIDVGTATNPQEVSTSLQILALMTILSLAPAILIMTTSFIRIIVVLSFLRSATKCPSPCILCGNILTHLFGASIRAIGRIPGAFLGDR